MRVAVVSDIHGNLAALEAVAAAIRRHGVDLVCNLGDSLSGPMLPKETAQFLMSTDWTHIAGNHERQLGAMTPNSSPSDVYAHAQLTAKELAWFATLPATARIGDDILLCHGTPTSDITPLLDIADRPATRAEIRERLGPLTPAVVLCGHTHVPRCVRSEATLVVNPGSVGLQAYADDLPYPHVIENGSPDARFAILEKGPAGWSVSLLSVPYDHWAMASLARLRQFDQWERALLTGYVG